MERLASFIKNSLNLTKTELIQLNKEGTILVNGKATSLQYNLKDSDVVSVNGKVIERIEKRYFAYNKKIGIVCTNDKSKENSLASIINEDYRLFSVGRLDKDSHGILLLTNDGDFCHDVLENPHIEKEYIVTLDHVMNEEELRLLEEPIAIKGKITNKANVIKIDDLHLRIILTDGKYHQIRRLVQRSNNLVLDLYRVRIGKYKIEQMQKEIEEINVSDVI